MRLKRRLVLLAPLWAAACATEPERVYTPPSYSYLTPLRLNVASLTYSELPPPGPLDSVSPLPPGPALLRLAQDRLFAGGSSGRAVVTVEQAQVVRANGGLDGVMALHVNVEASDGSRAAFAEARVSRHQDGLDNGLRTGLYDITKRMLDDMNVELEFQIRRSLRDYLQLTTTAPPPPAVQQQPLAPPSLAQPR